MDKKALFHISYGVYVITSVRGDEKNGFVGNSVFQITSEPARIAIGVSRDNYTYEFIKESGLFAISILNQDYDKNIIQTFGYQSGRETDKFANIAWHPGDNAVPVLDDDINATIECKVIQEVELGSHSIFIGDVTAAQVLDGVAIPLTYAYYHDVIKGRAPRNAPTYIEEVRTFDEIGGSSFICGVCHYEYNPELGDPDHGYPPGTPFQELPNSWVCPVCGASIDKFNRAG